jgi:hypothetical protein
VLLTMIRGFRTWLARKIAALSIELCKKRIEMFGKNYRILQIVTLLCLYEVDRPTSLTHPKDTYRIIVCKDLYPGNWHWPLERWNRAYNALLQDV